MDKQTTLSNRQIQLIKLLFEYDDWTNNQYAAKLNVSEKTIEREMHEIYSILELKPKNRVGIMKYACKHRIIDCKDFEG